MLFLSQDNKQRCILCVSSFQELRAECVIPDPWSSATLLTSSPTLNTSPQGKGKASEVLWTTCDE